MLNPISAQLGTSLAVIAHDRKLDLTPKAGTLLAELSLMTKNGMAYAPVSDRESVHDLPWRIKSSCEGSTVQEQSINRYACSPHDALMDNSIADLAQLMGGYVSYARTVVNPKINHLVEGVSTALSRYEIKEAEDFFEVSYYKLPDIFSSALIEDEVLPLTGRNKTADLVNFGEALQGEFDPSTYFMTGEEQLDTLIREWVAQVGKETVLSYLMPKSSQFELTLFGPAALNFYLTNYLFYRQLHLKQDIALNMSAVKILSVTAANRDYHASQLGNQLGMYRSAIKAGMLLSVDTHVVFSYMSATKYPITIYDESFEKLSNVSDAMEKIFGAIANGVVSDLTVDMVTSQGEEFHRNWKTVRGLYISYLTGNRASLLRNSLRLTLQSSIDLELEEDRESPLFDKAYTDKSLEMAHAYIDTLEASDADDVYKVCMEVMARYIYRFSNAYFFLREMYEILKSDSDIEPAAAAHAASVRYITDFLMEQLDVISVQTV